MDLSNLLSIYCPYIFQSERLIIEPGWITCAKSENIKNCSLKQVILRFVNSVEFDFGVDRYGRPCSKDMSLTSLAEIHLLYFEKTKSCIREQMRVSQFIITLSGSKNYENIPLSAAFTLAQVSNTAKQYKLYFNPGLEASGVLTWV